MRWPPDRRDGRASRTPAALAPRAQRRVYGGACTEARVRRPVYGGPCTEARRNGPEAMPAQGALGCCPWPLPVDNRYQFGFCTPQRAKTELITD